MPDVLMPRLSESMEEGTILRWLKADGDVVQRGDELAEIETDKATERFEATAPGVLAIVAAEGETLPVGAVIARLEAPVASMPAKGATTTQEPSRAQQALARRVAEAKATVPHVTVQAEIDMEACVALRAEHPDVGFDALVVKACALALRAHPRANGAYRDGRFERYARVNVGVTLATGDAVAVPTIFDADAKPLTEIARELRAIEARARGGELTQPELSGGTFTVTVLADSGVAAYTPIVTPPQAAALATGAVEQRAVVRDGAVVARHVMTATLSCDHRILYGAEAAIFLSSFRTTIEGPDTLLL